MSTSSLSQNILFVEDDLNISALTERYLSKHGFNLTCVHDGISAMKIFRDTKFDLILLDVMLPGIDGWRICQIIREESTVPIIMLTAKGEVTNRINGLSLGADDYLVKPFDPQELLARIQAVLRRDKRAISHLSNSLMKISYGDLQLDPVAYQVTLYNQRVELPRREYDLLQFLMMNPNQVFSRDMLIDRIWGFDFDGEDRVVDLYIKRIRQRLEVSQPQPWSIVTVRGVGYKWEVGT